MIVSTKQSDLAKGLSIVSRAVSPRTAMPVLGNTLIDANSGELRLSATNRELAISCWIAANITDTGAITIPARLLTEFVNSLPAELVHMDLATRTQTLRFSCGQFAATMKGIDASEFPLIPTYKKTHSTDAPIVEGKTYTVNAAALSAAIAAVTVAASQDENRPTLTGVECTFNAGELHMAATDGYRLATYSIDCTGSSGEKSTMIVPARSLSEVARIAGGATGDVAIVVGAKRNQLLFSSASDDYRVDVVSELIDARFPDYSAMIPKGHNTRTVADTAALQKAVRVALLFARDNANLVRFSIADVAIKIGGSSAEIGDNESQVDATVDGAPIDITLNGRYLLEALAHIATSQVTIETIRPTRPAMIRPTDGSYMALIMPMSPPR